MRHWTGRDSPTDAVSNFIKLRKGIDHEIQMQFACGNNHVRHAVGVRNVGHQSQYVIGYLQSDGTQPATVVFVSWLQLHA